METEIIDAPEQLLESLRSQKSYAQMQAHISTAPDNHFEHNARSILKHGLGNDDHAQNDYARHAVLFDHRLTDKHLDDISQHVASAGKTTNTVDKNFHKNVNSVGVLRAALKNDSPDVIADAKKSITADHKNAIFAHGSHEEKAFVIHHGMANKTQLRTALTSGNDALAAVAKSHLQSLRDSGSTKHGDLQDEHLPKLKAASSTGSFFSRLKDKFKENLGKRMAAAAAAPKERKDPTFEEVLDGILGTIATRNLHEATQLLRVALSEKAAEKTTLMKQELIDAKYNNVNK
jgi:hypothetical protein